MRNNGWSRLIAIALGALPATTVVVEAQQAAVAESGATKPTVRISPVILAEPELETTLRIQVGPDASIPRQTFLRIRGLPQSARLSEGHVVSPGIWAVPLAALDTLRLTAPLASSGRSELNLALVSVDGTVLAEARSSLVVAPAWLLGTAGPRQDTVRSVSPRREDAPPPKDAAVPQPVSSPASPRLAASLTPQAATVPAAPAPAPVASKMEPAIAVPPPPRAVSRPEPAPPALVPPPVPPVLSAQPPAQVPAPAQARLAALPPSAPAAPAPAAKAVPVLSAADRARAEGMVQRGDAFLLQGNMAAARQFFRRGADLGLALAALKLGSTYDPIELSSLTVVGMKPEPKEARFWYERAFELGATEASARLSRLQGR